MQTWTWLSSNPPRPSIKTFIEQTSKSKTVVKWENIKQKQYMCVCLGLCKNRNYQNWLQVMKDKMAKTGKLAKPASLRTDSILNKHICWEIGKQNDTQGDRTMCTSFLELLKQKSPRLGGLKKWKFIACSSGGGKSKIKELAGLVSSLLGLQVGTLSLPLPIVIHLCTTTSGLCLSL